MLFKSKRYGQFLKKALNRGSDFVGVVAVRTAQGISTCTADVISHTTNSMQEGLFTWRQETPLYFKQYSDSTWHTHPGWVQSVYARERHPSTVDWYKEVLAPISIIELRKCLAGCKNNKTGGKSGLSYEMIKALSDDTLVKHFVPLLNDIILTTGNISPTL